MNIYETKQNDTWDTIAQEVYKNELLADQLMLANIEKINVFIFDAGVKIKVPALEDKVADGLPAWRD